MIKKNSFEIDEIHKSGLSEIIIKNNSTNEFVSVIPDYGGRLKELWLNNGMENISILKKINRVDSEDRDDIFANAKLSPFAGRIKDGTYVFNNAKYNLLINYPEEKNACHGYVYPKRFRVTEKNTNADSALCRLEYSYDNENEGYPFKYSIELTYKLSASEGLICTIKIINQSENAIPLSDGWYHYFDLGIRIDDLQLKLEVSEIVELDSRNIPTGSKEEYNDFSIPAKIGNIQFDSCFKVKSNNERTVTKLLSPDHNIELDIWQETGNNKYEYIVIYTPPGRKEIAVEPITSNINSFNNREGLVVLDANEKFTASFGVSLKKIRI